MLVAVIVLPLLLEDEPPSTGPLEISMASLRSGDAGVPDLPPPAVVTPPAKPRVERPVPAPQPAPMDAPAPVARPAPPPAAKPAPPPVAKPAPSQPSKPATDGGAFVVQLAALSDSAKADALKGRLLLAGFPVYTDRSGAFTRVRVGPYKSRADAEQASAKLGASGFKGEIYTQ